MQGLRCVEVRRITVRCCPSASSRHLLLLPLLLPAKRKAATAVTALYSRGAIPSHVARPTLLLRLLLLKILPVHALLVHHHWGGWHVDGDGTSSEMRMRMRMGVERRRCWDGEPILSAGPLKACRWPHCGISQPAGKYTGGCSSTTCHMGSTTNFYFCTD